MRHKEALPPYRDSLYEVARALEGEKPLTRWLNEKKITLDSSVREVRSLRVGKGRKGKSSNPTKPTNKLRRNYPATISFSFETYTAAAEMLSSLLLSTNVAFRISAHQSFNAALRERLSDSDYEKAQSHVS
jgi:hypothetical protein